MPVEKKFLPKQEGRVVKANDQGGDLSKPWYIHWRQDGKPLKKYGKLAHINDVDERRAALEALRLEWQMKLDASQVEPVIVLLRKHLLKTKAERRWRWKTWQTNNSKITVLSDWLNGRPVTKENLKLFFEEWREKKSPITHNRYYSEFLAYFTELKLLHLFPTEHPIVKRAKRTSKPAQWLKKNEVANLKTAIDAEMPLIWLAIRFMYNLALRPGELRLMKAEYFYLDEGVAKVPDFVSKVGRERWVVIPPDFIPDIQFIREMAPNEYIFKSSDRKRAQAGHPVGKNHFTKKIRALMNRLGFDGKYKPCYSFRYTMAMRGLKDDGIDADEMRRQFGHYSLDQFIYYTRQFEVFDMKEFKSKFKGL